MYLARQLLSDDFDFKKLNETSPEDFIMLMKYSLSLVKSSIEEEVLSWVNRSIATYNPSYAPGRGATNIKTLLRHTTYSSLSSLEEEMKTNNSFNTTICNLSMNAYSMHGSLKDDFLLLCSFYTECKKLFNIKTACIVLGMGTNPYIGPQLKYIRDNIDLIDKTSENLDVSLFPTLKELIEKEKIASPEISHEKAVENSHLGLRKHILKYLFSKLNISRYIDYDTNGTGDSHYIYNSYRNMQTKCSYLIERLGFQDKLIRFGNLDITHLLLSRSSKTKISLIKNTDLFSSFVEQNNDVMQDTLKVGLIEQYIDLYGLKSINDPIFQKLTIKNKNSDINIRIKNYKIKGLLNCIDEMISSETAKIRILAADVMDAGDPRFEKLINDRSHNVFYAALEKIDPSKLALMFGSKKLNTKRAKDILSKRMGIGPTI